MNTVRINGQDYTSSLSDAEIAFIGNLSLPTTAQTLSGAIAEHENDISELNSKLANIGTYYTGSWTAESSSANNTQLTSKISLPKGSYIIIGCAPVLSASDLPITLKATSMADISFVGTYNSIRNRSVIAFAVTVVNDTQVWLATAYSSSTTYTNISDSKIRAVRIS